MPLFTYLLIHLLRNNTSLLENKGNEPGSIEDGEPKHNSHWQSLRERMGRCGTTENKRDEIQGAVLI